MSVDKQLIIEFKKANLRPEILANPPSEALLSQVISLSSPPDQSPAGTFAQFWVKWVRRMNGLWSAT